MKHICSLILSLGLLLSGIAPALAAGGLRVSGVVETPHALFFQPTQFPTVVWFFPKTELAFSVVPPELPSGTFWRAAIGFKKITADDLAMLPPEWATKAKVPYILRPTSECMLTRLPEMRFVVQEVKAMGRDVSSANPPVCRFTFRLPTILSADLQARLDALLNSDTLIQRSLNLELQIEAAIPWARVYEAVAAELSESVAPQATASPALSPEAARAAVESALASAALADVSAAVTPAEAEVFIDATLTKLFTASTTGTVTVLHLLTAAPTGSVVYHLEPFARSL